MLALLFPFDLGRGEANGARIAAMMLAEVEDVMLEEETQAIPLRRVVLLDGGGKCCDRFFTFRPE